MTDTHLVWMWDRMTITAITQNYLFIGFVSLLLSRNRSNNKMGQIDSDAFAVRSAATKEMRKLVEKHAKNHQIYFYEKRKFVQRPVGTWIRCEVSPVRQARARALPYPTIVWLIKTRQNARIYWIFLLLLFAITLWLNGRFLIPPLSLSSTQVRCWDLSAFVCSNGANKSCIFITDLVALFISPISHSLHFLPSRGNGIKGKQIIAIIATLITDFQIDFELHNFELMMAWCDA